MRNKRWINIMRGRLSTAPARHALFILFIAGILAYGAGFAAYMLANFDLINLVRDVSNDDAYYYFQIAYHLAEGKFSTFDGGITRTNGYHPLWMFAITPFYWVFDKETALFGIKAFEIMLIAGAIACIAGAARLARLPWVLLFPLPLLLYANSALFYGMEAAAALFMLGLFMLALMLYARNPARWTWPLAAVAFALPWVRLEYVAISLAATAALCVIEWSWRERPAGASWRTAILSAPPRALVLIGGAIAGILIYFLYNKLVFGGIVPVSGATKAAWSQSRWEQTGGYSFTQNLREVLQVPIFDVELLVALGICAVLVLVWWFARRSRDDRGWLLLVFLVGAFGLAAGHIAKFAQTALTVHPVSQGDFPWYFVPAYLMMAISVPISCYVIIYLIRRFIDPKRPRMAKALSLGIVSGTAILLLTQADFAGPFQYVDRARSAQSSSPGQISNYAGMLVMNRVLPAGSIIGGWDAGVTGYFSDFPVVNLDGLVNDYDFLREYGGLYGGGIDRLKDYAQTLHQQFGTTHYANTWPIRPGHDNVLYEGRLWYKDDRRGYKVFQLWTAHPITPGGEIDLTAWFWRRMEPHFSHQSDGVGLIADGRLAQAFARDCAPGELAVWSWGGEREQTVGNLWTDTQTGLCVDALVLPRNAGRPVKVETMAASDYYTRLVGGNSPAIRSNFNVYFVANKLIYAKEQCSQDDLAAAFFLHIDPVDANDLPRYRKLYGFDNLDFSGESVTRIGNTCWAEVLLPEYDIAEIRTGQSVKVDGGYKQVWQGKIRPE